MWHEPKCAQNMERIFSNINVDIVALLLSSFALEQRIFVILVTMTFNELQIYRKMSYRIVQQVKYLLF